MKKITFTILIISLISACSHRDATFPNLLASDSQEQFHFNHNKETAPLPIIDNGETFIGHKIKVLKQDIKHQTSYSKELHSSLFADFIKENNNLLKTIRATYNLNGITPKEQKELKQLEKQINELTQQIKDYQTRQNLQSVASSPLSTQTDKSQHIIIKNPIKSNQATTLSSGQDSPIFVIKLYNEHSSYQEALKTIIKSTLKQNGKNTKFFIIGLAESQFLKIAEDHTQKIIQEIIDLGAMQQNIFSEYKVIPNLKTTEIRIFAN